MLTLSLTERMNERLVNRCQWTNMIRIKPESETVDISFVLIGTLILVWTFFVVGEKQLFYFFKKDLFCFRLHQICALLFTILIVSIMFYLMWLRLPCSLISINIVPAVKIEIIIALQFTLRYFRWFSETVLKSVSSVTYFMFNRCHDF